MAIGAKQWDGPFTSHQAGSHAPPGTVLCHLMMAVQGAHWAARSRVGGIEAARTELAGGSCLCRALSGGVAAPLLRPEQDPELRVLGTWRRHLKNDGQAVSEDNSCSLYSL